MVVKENLKRMKSWWNV